MKNIPFVKNFSDKDVKGLKKIVIAIHGYTSCKEDAIINALSKELKKQSIGLLAFDLPGHGVNGAPLTVENCFGTIYAAENYLRQYEKPICFFGYSFGGYLTLLYLSKSSAKYSNIVLCAPAIDMYKAICNSGQVNQPNVDLCQIEEVKRNNVLSVAKSIDETIHIVYGTKDNVVDNNDIFKLDELINCRLYPVEGAGHDFQKPGELEKVISVSQDVYGGH